MARSRRNITIIRSKEVTITIDDTLTKKLQDLKEFFDESAARGIALAGAKVISQQARENASEFIYRGPPKLRYSGPGQISGKVVPGEFRDSIYHAFKDRESVKDGKQTYAVSWNTATTGFGHLLEHGHRVRNRKKLADGSEAPFFSKGKAPVKGKKIVTRAIEAKDAAFAAMKKRAYEKIDYFFNKGGA